MFELSPDEWTAVQLSLRIAVWATVVSLPFGVAVAYVLARKEFWGKALLDGIVHLPLVLPPVVTGDVRAVPVGRYAKAALEKLGAWTKAEPKMAMSENVRAALALVARGEAPLGIVYATDAKIEPGVKIIGTFPADSHPPIVYPFAATAVAKTQAERYLAFLRLAAAKVIFERYGFTVLAKPTS